MSRDSHKTKNLFFQFSKRIAEDLDQERRATVKRPTRKPSKVNEARKKNLLRWLKEDTQFGLPGIAPDKEIGPQDLQILSEFDWEIFNEDPRYGPYVDKWKGYVLSIAYEVYDEESIEAGEPKERGWQDEGTNYDSVAEVADNLDNRGPWEWSSGGTPKDGYWLTTSDPESDYRTGETKSYSAFIKRADGLPMSPREMKFLDDSLRASSWRDMPDGILGSESDWEDSEDHPLALLGEGKAKVDEGASFIGPIPASERDKGAAWGDVNFLLSQLGPEWKKVQTTARKFIKGGGVANPRGMQGEPVPLWSEDEGEYNFTYDPATNHWTGLKVRAQWESKINEDYRLTRKDKKVIDLFTDVVVQGDDVHGEPGESDFLTSDGRELRKHGLGGGVVAYWEDGKVWTKALTGRAQQTVVRYMNKVLPPDYKGGYKQQRTSEARKVMAGALFSAPVKETYESRVTSTRQTKDMFLGATIKEGRSFQVVRALGDVSENGAYLLKTRGGDLLLGFGKHFKVTENKKAKADVLAAWGHASTNKSLNRLFRKYGVVDTEDLRAMMNSTEPENETDFWDLHQEIVDTRNESKSSIAVIRTNESTVPKGIRKDLQVSTFQVHESGKWKTVAPRVSEGAGSVNVVPRLIEQRGSTSPVRWESGGKKFTWSPRAKMLVVESQINEFAAAVAAAAPAIGTALATAARGLGAAGATVAKTAGPAISSFLQGAGAAGKRMLPWLAAGAGITANAVGDGVRFAGDMGGKAVEFMFDKDGNMTSATEDGKPVTEGMWDDYRMDTPPLPWKGEVPGSSPDDLEPGDVFSPDSLGMPYDEKGKRYTFVSSTKRGGATVVKVRHMGRETTLRFDAGDTVEIHKKAHSRKNEGRPPKALLDRAVKLARLYIGMDGKTAVRDQQRVYNQLMGAVEKVASSAGMDPADVYSQVTSQAQRLGATNPQPGQHY